MRFLITGSAGFIGFHLARRLLADGHDVIGFDGLTPYYDVLLKEARHTELAAFPRFTALIGKLEDRAALTAAFEAAAANVVVHLAAQAGVRYSLEDPEAYIDANLTGSFNLLDLTRQFQPRHLLMASTSSVYGGNPSMPFRECDAADWPLTLYAATKKAMEAMSHAQAHLYGVPTTVFRFFTVYGPWGRPDMALFKFVAAMLAGEPIDLYGEGRMQRDFTYIDDLVEAIVRLIDIVPAAGIPSAHAVGIDSLSPVAPWRVVNIAGGNPVALRDFVAAIEAALGTQALTRVLPMQPGDVPVTWASHELLEALTGYRPSMPIGDGVRQFVEWYRGYYKA